MKKQNAKDRKDEKRAERRVDEKGFARDRREKARDRKDSRKDDKVCSKCGHKI